MSGSERYVSGSGQGLTWGDGFSAATLNSVGNGQAIVSNLVIDNSVALDMFCDVSVALGSITSGSTASLFIFVYPLNKDGTTYGDGRFGIAGAGWPGGYIIGEIQLAPSVTQAQEGSLSRIVMPPGKFKFGLYNAAGAALAGSSANTFQYRTYNRTVT